MAFLASLLTQVTYTSDTSSSSSGGGASAVFLIILYVAIAVIAIAGMWKTFSKAGQPGWAALIPILNIIVLIKLVKRPIWWIILMIIPCVNIVVGIILLWDLVKAFGKGAGMFILFLLLGPIGWLVLGFGKAEYQLEPEPLF